MKRFLFGVSVAMLSTSAARAGTEVYSPKETAATQPCPSWYADREWNVSLWGTYGFTANDYPTVQNYFPASPGFATHDTYLEAHHAWGGGVDAKFFFMRYVGIGVEGYALDVRQSYPDIFVDFFDVLSGRNFVRTSHDSRVIGSVLGTLTLRYPTGWSRFAPYLLAGGAQSSVAVRSAASIPRGKISPLRRVLERAHVPLGNLVVASRCGSRRISD